MRDIRRGKEFLELAGEAGGAADYQKDDRGVVEGEGRGEREEGEYYRYMERGPDAWGHQN